MRPCHGREPAESAGTHHSELTMYYVYIIKSLTKDFKYIGFSSDLKKRFRHHNDGGNTSTSKYRPFKIVYYEGYLSEKDARRRERFLKSGRGREIIEQQLEDSLRV